MGYNWDLVSVHYREGVLWRGVSAKRGSIVCSNQLNTIQYETHVTMQQYSLMVE